MGVWRFPKEHWELCLFVAAGLAIVLAPPVFGDFASLSDKAGHGMLAKMDVPSAFGLLLGTGSRFVQVPTLAIMVLGSILLVKGQPRLSLTFSVTAAAAVLTMVVSRPTGIEASIVLARYALFLLPLLLLILAIGLRALGGWIVGASRQAAVIIGLAWIVLLVKAGPLQGTYYTPNNFTNHGAFQYYPSLDPKRNPYIQTLDRPASPFYEELGKQPASSLRLLEAPWYYEWHFNPYPFYQRVHRQQVSIGFVKSEPVSGEWPAFDSRVHFRNFVHLLDMNSICSHGIDRVVIHKDLGAELGQPVDRDFSQELPALMEKYRQAYGPPIFEDVSLIVFDVTSRCPSR